MFVDDSAASLPRLPDGRIDWAGIDDETRAKFWRHHEHRWLDQRQLKFFSGNVIDVEHWLEPIWVDGEAWWWLTRLFGFEDQCGIDD